MPRRVTLVRRNPAGKYVEANNTASILSEIYRVTVPRGRVWYLDGDSPFLLLLTTVETIEGVGDHSAHAMTYGIARVLNSNAGYLDGKYQHVCLTADGTVRTITAVNDHVDSGADTITCSDETNADHQWGYVPFENGQVIIKVESPRGLGDLAYPIFEGNTKQIHAINQYRDQRISCPFPIPPDFSIAVYLDAAWPQRFVSGASAGEINFPFNLIQFPLLEVEERQFFVPGENTPGYTLRKRVEDAMLRLVH